jgi:hypothetical protein
MAFFIHKNNEQMGPFQETEIKTFIQEGRISQDDLCWKEGMVEWRPLKELILVTPPLKRPSPSSVSTNPDEVLWVGHPSMLTYSAAWIVSFLTIWFGVGLLLVLWIIWDKFANNYKITNKNVILTKGLINKSTNQIRIKDIRSINVIKKGLDGLLGVGDLEMSSSASDKAEVIFKGLRGATSVKEILMKKQDEMN